MNMAVTKPDETHDMELSEEWTDEFGLHWTLWTCPECGCAWQICNRPFQKLTLNEGKGALTQEIADESIRLRKLGKHAAANRLLAAAPAHRAMRGISGLDVSMTGT